jgi:hypothetical protein
MLKGAGRLGSVLDAHGLYWAFLSQLPHGLPHRLLRRSEVRHTAAFRKYLVKGRVLIKWH